MDRADVADQAAMSLGAIGEAAIPFLARALRDYNPELRRRAAMGLQRMGSTGAPALPDLERATADDDPDVRQAVEAAIQLIRNTGPEAEANEIPGRD